MSAICIPAEAITDVRTGAVDLLGSAAEELSHAADRYALADDHTDQERRLRYSEAFAKVQRLQAFIEALGDDLAASPEPVERLPMQWTPDVGASACYMAIDLRGRLSEGKLSTSELREMVARLEHLEALAPVADDA